MTAEQSAEAMIKQVSIEVFLRDLDVFVININYQPVIKINDLGWYRHQGYLWEICFFPGNNRSLVTFQRLRHGTAFGHDRRSELLELK